MIYEVLIDGKTLYYPADAENTILDSYLSLKLNQAGYFTCLVPSTHPEYENIKNRISMIQILKNGKEFFCGEVRECTKDFSNQKSIYAVGELSFLADSIQPQAKFQNVTSRQLLEQWLAVHNSQVEEKRRFYPGIVTVHDANDSLYRFTNQESTLECIRKKICDKLNGYLRIRKVNGKRYLDIVSLQEYGKICEQSIEFGKNLLDYSENASAMKMYTCVIPRGARLEKSCIDGLDAYVDITSVNNGNDYVFDQTAVDTYGWNRCVVSFDDVTVPANLKTKAEKWLKDNQFEDLTLKLSAVDLSILKLEPDTFDLGDSVRVVSPPHGMDRMFPVQALDLHLQDPGKDKVQLGNKTSKGYIQESSSHFSEIKEEIESNRQTTSFLQSAIENATQMMTGSKGGYKVTEFDSDGRWIRDLYMNAPTKEQATQVMQINMNGIGFSNTGFAGPYKNAWTIDGQLLGEFVKAGTIHAEKLSVEYKQSVTDEINAKAADIESRFDVSLGQITAKVSTVENNLTYNYCTDPNFKDLNKWTITGANVTKYFYATKYCVQLPNHNDAVCWKQNPFAKSGSIRVRFRATCDAAYVNSARLECKIDRKSFVVSDLTSDWKSYEFEAYATIPYFDTEFINISGGNIYVADVEIIGFYSERLESQVKILTDSIQSTVKKGEFGSYVQQHYDKVMFGFNNNSKYVQINPGQIGIYNYGVTEQKKRAIFDENGIHFYRDSYYVGKMGTNQWKDNNAHKGIVFDLETQGKYMTWAYKKNSADNFYTTILTFSRANSIYGTEALHAGTNLDMEGHKIVNPSWANGFGVTGQINFVQILEVDANGKPTFVGPNAYMRFENGILMDMNHYAKEAVK